MNEKVQLLVDNIEKAIIGKREVIIKLVVALISEKMNSFQYSDSPVAEKPLSSTL